MYSTEFIGSVAVARAIHVYLSEAHHRLESNRQSEYSAKKINFNWVKKLCLKVVPILKWRPPKCDMSDLLSVNRHESTWIVAKIHGDLEPKRFYECNLVEIKFSNEISFETDKSFWNSKIELNLWQFYFGDE